LFFSHSITLPRSYFLNLNGPVPIWASGLFRSPNLSSTCFAAMRHHADDTALRNGSGAGNLSLTWNVCGSTISVPATSGLRVAPHFGLLNSGFSTRSNVAFTSVAVNGWPSCHFTPLRR
jgi:hypothetical protein